jgi:hypothetical protein
MWGSSWPRTAPRVRWPNCSAPRSRGGTVAAMTARAAAGLTAFTDQVREQLTKADVAAL